MTSNGTREQLIRGTWMLCVACLMAHPEANGQEQNERIRLAENSSAGPAIPHFADQVFQYVFSPRAEKVYLLEVDQLGLDFVIAIKAPDGSAAVYDSPLERDERELVLLAGRGVGDYLIDLYSNELTNATGNHSIRIIELDMEQGLDANWIAALKHMTSGASAYAAGDKQRALDEYQAATVRLDRTSHRRELAQALYTLAYLKYWVSYDFRSSIESSQRAASIYENSLSEPALHAGANSLTAAALIEYLEFDAALRIAQDALSYYEAAGDTYELARIEEVIGYAYQRKGELPVAAEYRKRAANQFSAIGEWYKSLVPLARAAASDANRGYSAAAIDILEGVRSRLPDEADPFFVAEVSDGLGDAYRLNGQLNEALAHYESARKVHVANGDTYGEADSLRGIGNTYLLLGDLRLASEFLRNAISTAKGSNRLIEERATTALGTIDYLQGDFLSSFRLHQQALGILRSTETGDSEYPATMSRIALADRMLLIAKDLRALARYDEAEARVSDAKALLAGLDSPFYFAAADQELAKVRASAGAFQEAIELLESALTRYQAIGAEEGSADVLHELATAHLALGSTEIAVQFAKEALDHVESVRFSIAKPELRALYSSTRYQYYETLIDLLMGNGGRSHDSAARFASEALAISERARARMIMDLLAEASVDIRRGIDPDLSDRRRALRDQLASRIYAQESGDQVTERAPRDIAQYEHELNVLESDIRTGNPLYFGFSAPQTLEAEGFRELIDAETTVVQYSLGDHKSFAWVVTAGSLDAVELASREEIEEAATRVITRLRTYPADRAKLDEARRNLSELVLAPLQPLLVGSRIVVVADGVLHLVPFSVMPVESTTSADVLVSSHEIVSVPSMSVIQAIRTRRNSAPRARKTIAVFADPVFSERDPRLAGSIGSKRIRRGELVADSLYTQTMDLAQLPGTETEARIIEDLVPEDQRVVARGFGANRAAVVDADLGQYRYIHFATHGEVNAEVPALSRLFLSNFDESGEYENGTLLLDDIYNLRLNADLVVLSACDTALGRQIRGEGLVGLTQGFLYSGAKSVLVSLWNVPDLATAELMSRFYQNLLDQKQGLRPAEALRKAQSSMATEQRWSDPYFWGAFVLLGDWV